MGRADVPHEAWQVKPNGQDRKSHTGLWPRARLSSSMLYLAGKVARSPEILNTCVSLLGSVGTGLGSEQSSFGSTLIILHWTRSR